ncbi:MAG TPA: hypothetical protein PKI27_00755 [Dermatophilaceae bacterium]|nr:hypothetical protein [Dermatophilaceae bacterium]
MSSGHRRMQYNTRERLISTDFNREQAFIAADRSAFHRRFFSDQYIVDTSAGYAIEPAAITAPLLADVIGGLMVVPQIGTDSVTITPGEMVAYFPDATPNADDDPSKVIFDAGISAIGSLVIPANGGGGIRIDVIECQPIELVEEQDNRDIFDPATGLFTPNLVDKVVSGRLQYRVRSGVAGGGYPGNTTGWLPLAVASVPAGSASVDTVTFWDVRPLIVDRAVQPFHAGSLLQKRERCLVYADEWTNPGVELNVSGAVDFNVGYYRAAGTIAKGTPTAAMGSGDLPWVDILNPENQGPGFAPVPSMPWYLYACFPAGLPRWVRYTENSIFGLGRVPGPMRGIPVATMVAPNYAGTPLLAITMPTSTGLGVSTQNAGVVMAGWCDGGGAPRGAVSDGRMILVGDLNNGIFVAPFGTNINTDSYVLFGNFAHPANARRVRLKVYCNFIGAPGAAFSFSRKVYMKRFGVTTDNVCAIDAGEETGMFDAFGIYSDVFEVDVPLIPTWPGIAPVNRNLTVNYFPSAGVATRVNGGLDVVGWDLGP